MMMYLYSKYSLYSFDNQTVSVLNVISVVDLLDPLYVAFSLRYSSDWHIYSRGVFLDPSDEFWNLKEIEFVDPLVMSRKHDGKIENWIDLVLELTETF